MNKNWFKDWFSSKFYLELYKHRDEAEAKDIVNLIQREIPLRTDSRVLDVCCGAGRHSLELAKRGYDVTGFDLSKFLISEAKENLKSSKESSLNVKFLLKDMRRFQFKKKFDIAINIFTSFGYFDSDEQNFKVFENVSNSVRKNGYFVFDYLNEGFLKENLVAKSKNVINGKAVTQKRRIESDFIIKDIIFGKRKYTEVLKLYSYNTIKDVLKNYRFIVKNIFGDYLGNRYYSKKSKRLIIFAQKT
ncbi:class I SAM-dependent methyltransferase [Bacteroidota bacterium]